MEALFYYYFGTFSLQFVFHLIVDALVSPSFAAVVGQVIRMRNYVDPKRFYKASDKVSKFMQVRLELYVVAES